MIINDFKTMDTYLSRVKKLKCTHLTFKCDAKEVTTVLTHASNAWSVIRSMQVQYKTDAIDVAAWDGTGWISDLTDEHREVISRMTNIIYHEAAR